MDATAAKNDNTGTEQPASRRFARRDRLLEAASFGRVFKKAGRSKDRLFTVLYRRNGGKGARLGLAVSKKNCRTAVGRNRLKRLVRESFRQHKAELYGIDIVVLNQATTHKADNPALFESLEKHWRACSGGDRSSADRVTQGRA